MFLQVAAKGKAFFTYITLVRLLSAVGFLMLHDVVPLAKIFPANIALKTKNTFWSKRKKNY